MKKFLMVAAAVATTAMTMVSCDGGSSAGLKDNADSIAYYVGLAQSENLKQYMTMRLGIDSVNIDQFIKGVNEGATAGDDKAKAAYYAGIQIGQRHVSQPASHFLPDVGDITALYIPGPVCVESAVCHRCRRRGIDDAV